MYVHRTFFSGTIGTTFLDLKGTYTERLLSILFGTSFPGPNMDVHRTCFVGSNRNAISLCCQSPNSISFLPLLFFNIWRQIICERPKSYKCIIWRHIIWRHIVKWHGGMSLLIRKTSDYMTSDYAFIAFRPLAYIKSDIPPCQIIHLNYSDGAQRISSHHNYEWSA